MLTARFLLSLRAHAYQIQRGSLEIPMSVAPSPVLSLMSKLSFVDEFEDPVVKDALRSRSNGSGTVLAPEDSDLRGAG